MSKPNATKKTKTKKLVIQSFDSKRGPSQSDEFPIYADIASKKFSKQQERIHYDMPIYASFIGDHYTLNDFLRRNQAVFLNKTVFGRDTNWSVKFY